MSGRCASISPIAFSASLNDHEPTTLAPAPSAAVFAASTVRPGTNPITAIRNPPAALLEARTSLSSNALRSVGRSVNSAWLSLRAARACMRPSRTSVFTVDAAWLRPITSAVRRSTANDFGVGAAEIDEEGEGIQRDTVVRNSVVSSQWSEVEHPFLVLSPEFRLPCR